VYSPYPFTCGHQISHQEEIVPENHIQKPDDLSSTLDLLTLAETAAILKVSRKAVSTWVHQGALPAVKLGPGKRLVRVRRCDLEDFIAQGAMNDPGSSGGTL
jgi:excisionase family DNA binding protein